MSVDIQTVRRIAKLARIRVSGNDADLDSMTTELNAILRWVEQLEEIDTSSVAPMSSVVETQLFEREDQVTDGGYPDQIVENAPEAQDNMFVVPRVVE